MKKNYILLFTLWICSCISPLITYGATLDISGSTFKVLEYEAEKSTGLDKIYVVFDVSDVKICYNSKGKEVLWQRFSSMGGGFAEDVESNLQGNLSVLSRPEGNMGYIVKDGDRSYCFWIVEYKPQQFSVDAVSVSSESDCDYTVLDVSGNGAPIHYYTVNGQPKTLSRDIRIIYDTQEWDENSLRFNTIENIKVIESLTQKIMVAPPSYCSSSFTVLGDRFQEEWGMSKSAETAVAPPVAVKVESNAVQTESLDSETASNVISGSGEGLGGSAPAEITFTAYCTEGVLHDEWQMSRDSEFESIDYRFNERELKYIFEEEGTFYLRFIGSNSDGSCESIGEVYTVNIGASELLCPNAFSPDGDGVNDEWKVSYRSLIDFKCWIFDRNGNQLFHFTDPSQGWDGKRNGKVVKPGVYYYVIQATGADGRKYKKSGDINIIRYKSYGTSSSDE